MKGLYALFKSGVLCFHNYEEVLYLHNDKKIMEASKLGVLYTSSWSITIVGNIACQTYYTCMLQGIVQHASTKSN